MDIGNIKKLKVGLNVEWYETISGRRTGFRMGYTLTRIHYKKGLVWGKPTSDIRNWKFNATELGLNNIEISGEL
jgi:hypothetical protein